MTCESHTRTTVDLVLVLIHNHRLNLDAWNDHHVGVFTPNFLFGNAKLVGWLGSTGTTEAAAGVSTAAREDSTTEEQAMATLSM